MLCVFALSLHISVCAQSVSPEASAVQTATTTVPVVCCLELKELIKTPMPSKKTEFLLDEKAPLFDFGQGPQTYLLIELPAFSTTYSITISDIPQNGFFRQTSYTQLALRIQTLDAEYSKKREYVYSDMKKRGLGYEKTVFINPQNSIEKYILVRGVLDAKPEEVTISKTQTIFVGTGFYIGGEDQKIWLKPFNMGRVSIDSIPVVQAK